MLIPGRHGVRHLVMDERVGTLDVRSNLRDGCGFEYLNWSAWKLLVDLACRGFQRWIGVDQY